MLRATWALESDAFAAFWEDFAVVTPAFATLTLRSASSIWLEVAVLVPVWLSSLSRLFSACSFCSLAEATC